MKIILWPALYIPSIGGLEMMTHSLALGLKSLGHEVLVLTDGKEQGQYTIEGVEVFTFPLTRFLYEFQLSSLKTLLDAIHALLDKFSPQLVHIHGWIECYSFYQTRIFSKRKDCVCLTIHGFLEQDNYQTGACFRLWSQLSGVTVVSRSLLLTLQQQNFDTQKVRVIYNGAPIPKEPPQTPVSGPQRLLMIGRLSKEKRFDIGFHALKTLLEKRPDLKLSLLGGGPLYEDLLQLRHSLGLDHAVEMTNFVPPSQVQAYIDSAHLILIPSFYESFCLVALQAALRGRPVIASNVYGLKEVVENGRTGVLIEPNDPWLLAQTIDQLLSSPKQMEQMGHDAYQRAVTLFSIEKIVQDYVSFYQEVL